jgi:predicted ATP-dependent endonuclease of OLD family
MIGANNSGKSNLMDVLRVFYEKGMKCEDSRDFPKFKTEDKESWVDIEFSLNEIEFSNIKEEYKRPGNHVKVRKYLKTQEKGQDGKIKQGIYAYINDKISDEHFYGAKNVQQGKLGDLIYIPAVSKLDEHTKLTGPSALRDLLNDILKKLVKSSTAFQELTSSFESFTTSFKAEKTEDNKSLVGLEQDINTEIETWETEFELNINPVDEADIVKNLVTFKIFDKALAERMDASQFGQGFQRHLIYTLILIATKYQTPEPPKGKKEFSPNLSLLLFEEPEAFLHPMQQSILCRNLQTISTYDGNQVFVSSHSSHFVSHNADDIPSIIRLNRNEGKTCVGQINDSYLKQIFTDNQKINELLAGTKFEAEEDDLKDEMEGVKYFLWLNPERCGLFFSRQVLLVEGPTERVLINYFLDTGRIEMPKGGLFVLDCMGKFNIHRFMNLLCPFNVTHSVLFDEDNSKDYHKKIYSLIQDSKNALTYKIDSLPGDIEAFLGIEKAKRPDRKPQHMMLKLKESAISEDKINSFIEIVKGLIRYE